MVDVSPVTSSITTTSSNQTLNSNKSNKPRYQPSHPPTSEMVQIAIATLHDHRGTSLQAIKKFITVNYQLSIQKITPLVKRYLRSAVASGKLIQTRGKGASGSFKLPAATRAQRKSSKKPVKSDDLRKNSTINMADNNTSINIPKDVIEDVKKMKNMRKDAQIENRDEDSNSDGEKIPKKVEKSYNLFATKPIYTYPGKKLGPKDSSKKN